MPHIPTQHGFDWRSDVVVDLGGGVVMARFTEEEKETIWSMRETGVPIKRIARHLGPRNSSLRTVIAPAGGAFRELPP